MAEQARRLRKKKEDEERGVQSLFGEDDALLHAPIQPGERLYIHDPAYTAVVHGGVIAVPSGGGQPNGYAGGHGDWSRL